MTEEAAVSSPDEGAPGKRRPKGAGGHALDWWRHHCDPDREGHDPGTRARLRRCDSPIDAATIPAAVSLARRIGAFRDGADEWHTTAALNLARVLAHVREHAQGAPMRAAGWKHFGDWDKGDAERPVLSEARFRRLLTTGSGEEQVSAFVRLIALLDGTADVAALAAAFMDWGHPWRGEQVRKRWAEDYYAARVASATPDTNSPPTTGSAPTTVEDDA